jgi:hypothetical protein
VPRSLLIVFLVIIVYLPSPVFWLADRDNLASKAVLIAAVYPRVLIHVQTVLAVVPYDVNGGARALWGARIARIAPRLASQCWLQRCVPDISARWTDDPSRPPFERHPTRVRDPVALDSDRLAVTPNGLVPRSCETGADETGDCVTTDPMDEYKQFPGGAVRTLGEQF